MAKYSAEELSTRINDLELADDVKVSLMEDITDSVVNDESEELSNLKAELEKSKSDYDSLLSKYKERFLKSEDVVEEKESEKMEDLEEKEIIDIKEI